MKDKRKKHRWFIPIPSESTYQVGGTTYIVSSQFAERTKILILYVQDLKD